MTDTPGKWMAAEGHFLKLSRLSWSFYHCLPFQQSFFPALLLIFLRFIPPPASDGSPLGFGVSALDAHFAV
jgi:hypothetical protein